MAFNWKVYTKSRELFVPLKIEVKSTYTDIVSLLAKLANGAADIEELDEFTPSRSRVEKYIRDNYRNDGADDTWTWHDGLDGDELEPYMKWARGYAPRLWPEIARWLEPEGETSS